MNLLNNANNFITEDEREKHIVKRYEFRSMDKELEAQIAPSMEENGFYIPSEEPKEAEVSDALREQFQRLFEENQKLLHALKLLEERFDALSPTPDPAILEELKKGAYEQGLSEGEKRVQERIDGEIQAQKERLILSIEQIDKEASQMQSEIQKIREDLSSIALDLAKEVILREVQESSAKIAIAIATELLQPLEKSTKITLKAHPLDLPDLQQRFPDYPHLSFESDLSLARGGVMILSLQGNFDGSILSRYKNLKRSLLDEKGL